MQRSQRGSQPNGQEVTELRRGTLVNRKSGGSLLARDHLLGKVAASTRQMQAPVWANCVNPAALRKAPSKRARTVQQLLDLIVAALLHVLGRRAAWDSAMRPVLQVAVVSTAVFLLASHRCV